jgi:tight adherence protein B
MGAAVGLLLGLGLLLIWRSGPRRPPRRKAGPGAGWHGRTIDVLAQADLQAVTPGQLVVVSVVLSATAGLLVLAVSRTSTIAMCFGCFAACGPWALVRFRQRQRAAELRSLWPEAVDNLASGVRAGLALPEALAQLGIRGPEPLRHPFQIFAEDYRATGRFGDSLDRLKARLADPVGDRIVESLRLARDVGGSDLGGLLRTLSTFLRDDARTRAELETRQGWTVNAARLAVAAPWLLLAILALRPEAVLAYNTTAGAVVLGLGGGLSVVAYRVMKRIARLPSEIRVLR